MMDLDALENELSLSLNPVQPRMEFVTKLKTKLTHSPQVVLEIPHRMHQYILMIGGVLGGVLLIWGVRRILTYLQNRDY